MAAQQNWLGDLTGVALITGAGSGMGRACALAFAEQGATLVLVDVVEAGLKETVSLLKTGPNAKVSTHVLDICDDKAVIELIQSIPKQHGRLDYALNCAGVLGRKRGPMAEADTADDDWIMNINVRAQGVMMKEELKVMLAQDPLPGGTADIPKPRGCIVNWCSWVSFHGSATSWAYSASKHALASMTKSAAIAHAQAGIRCNGLAPGVMAIMQTALFAGDPASKARMSALAPANRPGQPKEVADATLFLCSDRASYINGAILSVDGAWNAK